MEDETVGSDLLKHHFRRVLTSPLLVGLFLTAASFCILLLTFKIGYGINDDIVMISIVSGAFGKASEFLVHSNVLWGLFLKFFYQFPTLLNWEIIFFVIGDFLSIWGLLYIILSSKTNRFLKPIFVITLLLGNGYFLLSISFTAIAAISATAGFALIFFQPERVRKWLSLPSASGIGLILISSLIRNISTLMIAVLFLPIILMNIRYFLDRRFVFPTLLVAFLVGGGFLYNKFYVESSPSWSTFYSYNYAHAQLINTPHFENSKGILTSVGWTQNDYDLMYDWFFADRVVFSPEKMLTLVKNSSSFATAGSVIQEFETRIFTSSVIPYLLLLGLGAFAVLFSLKNQKAILTLFIVFITPLMILFILAFTQKLVNYVTIPLLMGSISLEFLLFGFFSKSEKKQKPVIAHGSPGRIYFMVTISMILLAGAGYGIYSLFQSSRSNATHQLAYEQILAQFDQIDSSGILPDNAHVFDLSGSGIPWDWSNPWIVQFPKFPIQIMGWLTFSPLDIDSITQVGAKSLPDALVHHRNVYLITNPEIAADLETYYAEHDRLTIKFTPIVEILDTGNWIIQFEQVLK